MIEISSMVQLLIDAGFSDGWALAGDDLVLWEHEVDPPSPLMKPSNSLNVNEE